MKTEDKDGGTVFPCRIAKLDGRGFHFDIESDGLSLRDYFAGQALAGYVSRVGNWEKEPDVPARIAYLIADAMIETRCKNDS